MSNYALEYMLSLKNRPQDMLAWLHQNKLVINENLLQALQFHCTLNVDVEFDTGWESAAQFPHQHNSHSNHMIAKKAEIANKMVLTKWNFDYNLYLRWYRLIKKFPIKG